MVEREGRGEERARRSDVTKSEREEEVETTFSSTQWCRLSSHCVEFDDDSGSSPFLCVELRPSLFSFDAASSSTVLCAAQLSRGLPSSTREGHAARRCLSALPT
jgi:hypothetical protein